MNSGAWSAQAAAASWRASASTQAAYAAAGSSPAISSGGSAEDSRVRWCRRVREGTALVGRVRVVPASGGGECQRERRAGDADPRGSPHDSALPIGQRSLAARRRVLRRTNGRSRRIPLRPLLISGHTWLNWKLTGPGRSPGTERDMSCLGDLRMGRTIDMKKSTKGALAAGRRGIPAAGRSGNAGVLDRRRRSRRRGGRLGLELAQGVDCAADWSYDDWRRAARWRTSSRATPSSRSAPSDLVLVGDHFGATVDISDAAPLDRLLGLRTS